MSFENAVKSGNIKLLEDLIDQGNDPNDFFKAGELPLTYAILSHNYKLADFLIENGANIHGIDKKGLTVLQHAVKDKNNEAIKYVSELEDINHRDSNGKTILHYLFESIKSSDDLKSYYSIIKLLTVLNIDWKIEDHSNKTAIDYLIDKGLEKDINTIIDELSEGDSSSSTDDTTVDSDMDDTDEKFTLDDFIEAARQGDMDALNYIDDLNIDDEGSGGSTALIEAVANENYDFANSLLDHGADPNVSDISGYTPLMYAIANDNVRISMRLVSLGADLNHVANDDESPISMIEDSDNSELLILLESFWE